MDTSDIWNAAIKEHNRYRQNHGVPDVMGCDEMHKEAQKWAEHLAAANKFELDKNSKYIGNIASSFRLNEEDAVREAIKRWYSTVQNYHWNKPGFQEDSGAFSAIVWKNVTHLGVGIAWNEQAATYVIIVYYSPSPNICQEFKENVLKPTRIQL